jgi:hypothetical protein
MDYTCRSCSVGRLSQDLTDKIYSVEQRYKVKPVAFGLKRISKKHKKHKKHNNKTKSKK